MGVANRVLAGRDGKMADALSLRAEQDAPDLLPQGGVPAHQQDAGAGLLRELAQHEWKRWFTRASMNLRLPVEATNHQRELLVAAIQAYVFALLTSLYLNDAINLH